ncbi:hypothetical protein QVD17_41324 [Tagetes erecta]|uniref:Uncharacterized protein n=1 Tax=Tagetes erecta TaxID=13708 RepID=A0AAD8NB68_TARER|nr:hypothetical protein QVD17_41324 [Tagetes erecta]
MDILDSKNQTIPLNYLHSDSKNLFRVDTIKMTYAGVEMFMEKLKQLINNPLINNKTVRRKGSEFQLLYQDLDSMIQTLFNIDQHQDEKLDHLKKRFTCAAEEAQYVVDLFLSGVHIRNTDDVTI